MNDTTTAFRPMSLGEILDKAFRLYRQYFLKLIGIYAIPFIPIMVIQILVTTFLTSNLVSSGGINSRSTVMGFAVMAVVVAMIAGIAYLILVSGFATAALTRAVSNGLTGKPVDILESYRSIAASGMNLVGALILGIILLFVVLIWALIPIVGWFTGPGIFMFLMLIVYPLLAPVIALENQGAVSAIRRSWDLGRTRFWWLIGFTVVLALLGQLIVTGPIYLMSALLQGALSAVSEVSVEMQMSISNLISGLTNIMLNLLYMPLQLTMFVVVYFDLRARNEGLDLALQLAPAADEAAEVQIMPEIRGTTMPFFTGMDLGRFALLSLMAMMLFGLYFVFIFFILAIIGLGASGL